jgi:hypothetical protein
MEMQMDSNAVPAPEVSQESTRRGDDVPGEDRVDQVIAESFPASDPPQWWAGPPG